MQRISIIELTIKQAVEENELTKIQRNPVKFIYNE